MEITELNPAFTLRGALATGLRKDQVYDMLAAGTIERIGHGVYIRPKAIDPAFASLAAAAIAQPTATMCLTSALAYHDLTDAIPFGTDIALPRGTRFPAGFDHVTWHSFDPATFAVGRDIVEVDRGIAVAIYSAPRTIVDCFRLMYQEGSDVAYEALRRWIRHRGNSPASLMRVASSFPRVRSRLYQALEVLL